jgi:hypothetical protein
LAYHVGKPANLKAAISLILISLLKSSLYPEKINQGGQTVSDSKICASITAISGGTGKINIFRTSNYQKFYDFLNYFGNGETTCM